MKGKTVRKILGGMLATLMFVANMSNVFAVLYVTKSAVSTQDLSLWSTTDTKDITEGFARVATTIKTGNVVEVKFIVSTEGTASKPLESAQARAVLTQDILDNFDVNVPTQEGVSYDGTMTMNWVIGDLPVNAAKTLTYTLTPKQAYNIENFKTAGVTKNRFYVGSLFQVVHGTGTELLDDNGTQFKIFEDNRVCIPYVILSETNNPTTGLFTDVIILSAIVVAAAGILYITLKNNRFAKI